MALPVDMKGLTSNAIDEDTTCNYENQGFTAFGKHGKSSI